MSESEMQEIQRKLAQAKAVRDSLKAKQHQTYDELNELQRQVFGEDQASKKADQLKAALVRRFDENAGEDHLMDMKEFAKALGMRAGKPDEETLSTKIFNAMAKENDTHITREMFVETITKLNTGTFDERMKYAFRIFDTDNNGLVSEDEFMAFLKCSLLENRLKTRDFDDEADTNLREVVHEIFKDRSVSDGGITLAQFNELLVKSDLGSGLKLTGLESRSRSSDSTWRVPEPGNIKRFVVNNRKRIYLFIISAFINIYAFVYKWQENDNGAKFELMGNSLPLAKGCAEVMKVTLAFLMVFMCRGFITIWRGSWIGESLIEFDDAIAIHKINAEVFFVMMWVHVISHVVNVEHIIDPDNYDRWRAAYPDDGTTQWSRWDVYTQPTSMTGIFLTIGFSIVFFFALEYPRNLSFIKNTQFGKFANNFNVFWGTHHIVFPMFVLFMLHPLPGICWDPCDGTYHGDSWQWLLIPLMIYLVERNRRYYKEILENTRPDILLSTIKKGSDKPVLQLRMTKPDSWRSGPKKAEAGMYCFIKCKEISDYEWHPFTLTSAPHEDFMEVHVRGLGDWTGELCRRFGEVEDAAVDKELADQDNTSGALIPKMPTMALEGPYGAPAQGYDRFKVLLLVGAGIGVTPFISILKDIWHKFDTRRCKGCHTVNQKNFPLKKAYFNFISRDQASMSWFKDTLTPIIVDDKEHIIECHQHLTSVKQDGDVRSAAIKIAQNTSIGMEHDRHALAERLSSGQGVDDMEDGFAGKDIVTGSEANIPVHFGRPDWDKIFKYIKKQHPLEEVGVFFCGPPVVGAQLEKCSNQYTETNDTQFFYYEEHF